MTNTDCSLNANEVRELLAIGTIVKFRKSENIFVAGQLATELHYILNGWVNVYKVNDQGQQVSVGLRYPGDFAGLGSVVCCDERGCCSRAMIDSEIVIVPRDKFFNLLKLLPDLNLKMFCMLGSRLRDTQNSVMHFISQQTDKRLAVALLNIAQYLGKPDGQKRMLKLTLSQEELAHIIGCSRQTVNALLADFKKRNFIETQGREIISVNPEILRNYLEKHG